MSFACYFETTIECHLADQDIPGWDFIGSWPSVIKHGNRKSMEIPMVNGGSNGEIIGLNG